MAPSPVDFRIVRLWYNAGMTTILLAALILNTVTNVPYHADISALDDYAKRRCTLDLRYPSDAKSKNYPTVVWFHGGGLRPPKTDHVGFNNRLPERYGQVTVNYRCFDENGGRVTADEILSDAAAATAWTIKNIVFYGGDAKRIYIAGSSAGGYLAMMVGMNPALLAAQGVRNTDLAGVIGCSGQGSTHFNVKRHSGDPRFATDAGCRFLVHVDKYAPMYYCAEKELPPIVALVGESPWEWKTRAAENRLFVESLRAFGHKKVWYVSLPYVNHARTSVTTPAYIELFVDGRLPEPLENTRAPDVR